LKVQGATVLECLEAVEADYPGFRAHVLDGNGRVHRFVRLFVNGQPVASDALDTPVEEQDEVEVLAAIAGG
jgi:sulfur carrier protein ThiS